MFDPESLKLLAITDDLRDGREPRTRQPVTVESAEVGWILEDDGIAALHEKRHDQVNRLLRARRYQDLLGLGRHALA